MGLSGRNRGTSPKGAGRRGTTGGEPGRTTDQAGAGGPPHRRPAPSGPPGTSHHAEPGRAGGEGAGRRPGRKQRDQAGKRPANEGGGPVDGGTREPGPEQGGANQAANNATRPESAPLRSGQQGRATTAGPGRERSRGEEQADRNNPAPVAPAEPHPAGRRAAPRSLRSGGPRSPGRRQAPQPGAPRPRRGSSPQPGAQNQPQTGTPVAPTKLSG